MADQHSTTRLAECDLAQLLETEAGKFTSGRITFDIDLLHPLYVCDAGLLSVAVRNLLANAFRVFHTYYRGRQAQQSAGAGLGLFMVQRIAQLHGGDVQLVGAGGNQDVCFLMQVGLAYSPWHEQPVISA